MKKNLNDIRKIFKFTFLRHVKKSSYIKTIVISSIVLMLLPALIMTVVALADLRNDDDNTQNSNMSENVKNVYVVDLSGDGEADYSILNSLDEKHYNNIVYSYYDSVDAAVVASTGSDSTLILIVENAGDKYDINVVLPDQSTLERQDASEYADFIDEYYSVVQVIKSKLDYTQIIEITKQYSSEVVVEEITEPNEEETAIELSKRVLSMILPYVTVMLMYFMILAYGQSVANSIVMEKTSKLMDTLLISVKPVSIILGKIYAIVLTAFIEIFVWALSVCAGFGIGTAIVKAIDPDTEMGIIQLFDSFGSLNGMFTIPNIIFTVVILFMGFLLYCSLSAIGGALANKPEDLSSTNIIFTLALVVSFLSLIMGNMFEMTVDSWQVYMPFSAVLISPGMMLLGELPLVNTIAVLGVVTISSLTLCFIAAKIYRKRNS